MKKQANVTNWEDLFLGQYRTASEQVEQQAQYDISSAYANYKKSQLQLMQNQQLGTGFKEQVAADLFGQYETEYAQTRANELQNLMKIQQTASTELSEQEKLLQENSEKMAAIREYAISNIDENYLNELASKIGVDISKVENRQEALEQLGIYVKNEEGDWELSEEGVDLFDKIFNSKGFDERLQEYDKDLADFYLKNYDFIKQTVGGLESGDVTYETSERRKKLDADYAEKNFEQNYAKYYDKTLEFESQEEKLNYYSKLNQGLDIIDKWNGLGTDYFKNNIKSDIKSILFGDSTSGYSLDITSGKNGALTVSIQQGSLVTPAISQKDKEYLESLGFEITGDSGHKYYKWKGNKESLKTLYTELSKLKTPIFKQKPTSSGGGRGGSSGGGAGGGGARGR